MFKEGYIASFNGMGYQIKDILKQEGIDAPKGFFDREDYYENFKVVDDNDRFCVGIWFADIEEDKFINIDGSLTDTNPSIFYVNRDEVTVWG